MTKDKIETRLQALQKDFETARRNFEIARANVDAIAGAIQDCQYWLSELEPESTPDQKD